MVGLITLGVVIIYGTWPFWEAFYIITLRCRNSLRLPSRGALRSVQLVSDEGIAVMVRGSQLKC